MSMRAFSSPPVRSPKYEQTLSKGQLLRARSEASLNDFKREFRCHSPSSVSARRFVNATSVGTSPSNVVYGAPKLFESKDNLQIFTPDPKGSKCRTNLQSSSPDPACNRWTTLRKTFVDTFQLDSVPNTLISSQQLAVGQKVYCQDNGDKSWMRGVVTVVDPVVKVLPHGWCKDFSFDMVRATSEAGHSPERSPNGDVGLSPVSPTVHKSIAEKMRTVNELTAEATRLQKELFDIEKELAHMVELASDRIHDFEARVTAVSKRLNSIEESVFSCLCIKHSRCSILFEGLFDRCKAAANKIGEIRDCMQHRKLGTTKQSLFQWHSSETDIKSTTMSPARSTKFEPQAEPSPCPMNNDCDAIGEPKRLISQNIMTVRGNWQRKFVDKRVTIPETHVKQKIVDVPLRIVVERAHCRDFKEIVQLRRERPVEQHHSVPKPVPRISLQKMHKFEQIPLTLKQEFIQEQLTPRSIEFVREELKAVEEVREKQVPLQVFNFVHEEERVPSITKKEQIVEILKQKTLEVTKEVAVNVTETIEKPITKDVCEISESIEYIDMTELHEKVTQIPEKVVVEHVREIPKIVTEYIERKVTKPVYEYIDVIQEVPFVVHVEEVVEVPEIQRRQIIKEVQVPVVKHIDKMIPKHEMRVQTRTIEYPLKLRREVATEVPETRHVEIVTRTPKIKIEEIRKPQAKVRILAEEVYEDVPMPTVWERPARVVKIEHCDVVTQLPVKVIQKREKKMCNCVPIPFDRIDCIPVELSEEIVKREPRTQVVQAVRQELDSVVQQEFKQIPKSRMDYMPKKIVPVPAQQAHRSRCYGSSTSNHSRNTKDVSLQLSQHGSKRSFSAEKVVKDSAPIVHKKSLGCRWIAPSLEVGDDRSSSPTRK